MLRLITRITAISLRASTSFAHLAKMFLHNNNNADASKKATRIDVKIAHSKH